MNLHGAQVFLLTLVIIASMVTAACTAPDAARPRSLAELPARNLAFRFEPDVAKDKLPAQLQTEGEIPKPHEAVENHFKTARPDDALLFAVASPDAQKVLAIYGTSATIEGEYKMDLYNAEGVLQQVITPRELSLSFPGKVAWSPDGEMIAFIAMRSSVTKTEAANKSLNDSTESLNSNAPPSPPTVPAFSTEQIYFCDKEGFALRPVTVRDGLVFFHFTWSPDSRALVALANKPSEFDDDSRRNIFPMGRPRVILLNGGERLLDDRRTNALPVWSPDSSKIATAYQTDNKIEIVIYDAVITPATSPAAASFDITNQLRTASQTFDANITNAANSNINSNNSNTDTSSTDNASASNVNTSNVNTSTTTQPSPDPQPPTPDSSEPLSFNPVVRLAWFEPATLYVQTGFVRRYANTLKETKQFMRWHTLYLSPNSRAGQ